MSNNNNNTKYNNTNKYCAKIRPICRKKGFVKKSPLMNCSGKILSPLDNIEELYKTLYETNKPDEKPETEDSSTPSFCSDFDTAWLTNIKQIQDNILSLKNEIFDNNNIKTIETKFENNKENFTNEINQKFDHYKDYISKREVKYFNLTDFVKKLIEIGKKKWSLENTNNNDMNNQVNKNAKKIIKTFEQLLDNPRFKFLSNYILKSQESITNLNPQLLLDELEKYKNINKANTNINNKKNNSNNKQIKFINDFIDMFNKLMDVSKYFINDKNQLTDHTMNSIDDTINSMNKFSNNVKVLSGEQNIYGGSKRTKNIKNKKFIKRTKKRQSGAGKGMERLGFALFSFGIIAAGAACAAIPACGGILITFGVILLAVTLFGD